MMLIGISGLHKLSYRLEAAYEPPVEKY